MAASTTEGRRRLYGTARTGAGRGGREALPMRAEHYALQLRPLPGGRCIAGSGRYQGTGCAL